MEVYGSVEVNQRGVGTSSSLDGEFVVRFKKGTVSSAGWLHRAGLGATG